MALPRPRRLETIQRVGARPRVSCPVNRKSTRFTFSGSAAGVWPLQRFAPGPFLAVSGWKLPLRPDWVVLSQGKALGFGFWPAQTGHSCWQFGRKACGWRKETEAPREHAFDSSGALVKTRIAWE